MGIAKRKRPEPLFRARRETESEGLALSSAPPRILHWNSVRSFATYLTEAQMSPTVTCSRGVTPFRVPFMAAARGPNCSIMLLTCAGDQIKRSYAARPFRLHRYATLTAALLSIRIPTSCRDKSGTAYTAPPLPVHEPPTGSAPPSNVSLLYNQMCRTKRVLLGGFIQDDRIKCLKLSNFVSFSFLLRKRFYAIYNMLTV